MFSVKSEEEEVERIDNEWKEREAKAKEAEQQRRSSFSQGKWANVMSCTAFSCLLLIPFYRYILSCTILPTPFIVTYCCLLPSYLMASRGVVSKLSVVFKLLNFKQCLIYTWLNFQNDGFDSKFYFLIEKQQHYIKQFCLKLHTSLDNIV